MSINESDIDLSVVGDDLGAPKPVEVPATRYSQGGRCAHDRVAVSHLRFLLSHASTIATLHHAANSPGDSGTGGTRPDRTCGRVY